jgi:DNA-directed RNA polymerase specialized sigma24 family protein
MTLSDVRISTDAGRFERLSVGELVQAVRARGGAPASGNAGGELYAMELVRRAVLSADQASWAALVDLYDAHIQGWCRRMGAMGDLDDVRSEAWARFWRYFTADKLARCPGIAGVLQYLKMCVASIAIDRQRRAAERRTVVLVEAAHGAPGPDVELANRASCDEFWKLIQTHTVGEPEQVVLQLSYVEGLHPQAIAAQRPDLFRDVHTVYCTKRRLLDRLRRSPRLRAWATTI